MADANLDIKVNVEGNKAAADLDKLSKQAEAAARRQAQAAVRLSKIEADAADKANKAIEAKARAAERAAQAAERAALREAAAKTRAAQVAQREADRAAAALARQQTAVARAAAAAANASPAGRATNAFIAQGQRVAQASYGLNTGAAPSASARTGIGPALAAQAQAATRAAAATNNVANANRNVANTAGQAATNTNSLIGSLKRMAAGYFGLQFLADQFSKLVDAATAADRIFAGLKFSTGSAELAGKELQFVTAQAKRLGLPLKESAEQYARLASAATAAGLSVEDTRQIFLGASEYATVLGGMTKEAAMGTLTALQQMANKGKVSSEELRQQLGDRLPGAMALAAKSTGMSVKEFQKNLDKGRINSKEFLTLFAQGLRDAAQRDLPEATKMLQAELNRMENAVFQFRTNIITGGAGEAIKDMVRSITAALEDPNAKEAGKAIGGGFAIAVKTIMEAGGILMGWFTRFTRTLGYVWASLAQDFISGAKVIGNAIQMAATDDPKKKAFYKQRLDSAVAENKAAREAVDNAEKRWQLEQQIANDPKLKKAKERVGTEKGRSSTGDAGYYPGQDKDRLAAAKAGLLGEAADKEKTEKALRKRLSDANAQLQEAIAEAEKSRFQDNLAEQEKALEQSYAARLKTERQYLQDKFELQAKEAANELAFLQRRFTETAARLNDPDIDAVQKVKVQEDLVKLAADIEKAGSKQRQLSTERTTALQKLTTEAKEFQTALKAEIESEDGVSLVDQLKALDAQYAALRAKYADDEVVLGLLGIKQKRDTFKLKSDAAQKDIGNIDQSLKLREDQLQQDYNEGLLTTLGLQRQLAAARIESARALEAEVLKFQQAFDESGKRDPAIFNTIEQLKLRIRELRYDAESFGVQLARSVGSAFENNIKSARNFKGFMLGMIEDVLLAIRDKLAKQASEMLMNSLGGLFKGSGGSSGGGGIGSFLSSIGSLFGYADGGLAGADRSTSSLGMTPPGPKFKIAGFAHSGEMWFNQLSTGKLLRKYGRGFLEYMNRFGDLPRRGYATGGLAGSAPMSVSREPLSVQGGPVNVAAALYLDPEHAADAMLRTKSGEARFIELLMKHQGKLGR